MLNAAIDIGTRNYDAESHEYNADTCAGILHCSHEYTIIYVPELDLWLGDVIDADGWHDIEGEELENVVSKVRHDFDTAPTEED